jgi:hypothetical protein
VVRQYHRGEESAPKWLKAKLDYRFPIIWLRRLAVVLKTQIKKALCSDFAQGMSLQLTQDTHTREKGHGNRFDQRKLYGTVAGLLCENWDTN